MFAAFVTRFEQSFAALPTKVRTFLAIRVGDEVEAAIYRLIEALRAPNDGVAWARRDKLHVTLKFLGAAIDSVVGVHEFEAVPYGTDASSLALAGIPSVVFGPGDIAQAHTADEWIELQQVEQAAEILFRFVTSN